MVPNPSQWIGYVPQAIKLALDPAALTKVLVELSAAFDHNSLLQRLDHAVGLKVLNCSGLYHVYLIDSSLVM